MTMISKTGENYLKALNLSLEVPSFSFLSKICHAYLTTFPFENISKLIYFRDRMNSGFTIPPYHLFIQNHDKHQFGGTCYSINSNLYQLLIELGIKCYLIMPGNVHMAIIVEIEGEHVYVDCGAAAPFFTPVKFETNPENLTEFGSDKIQLIPVDVENYEYKFVRFIEGKQSGNGWDFNSRKSYRFTDFKNVIEESNKPNADFMKILRCQIWQPELKRSVSLVNNQLTIRKKDGTSEKHILNSIAEIKAVLNEEFLLPKLPIEEAIDILKNLNIDIFQKETAR